MPNLRRQIKGLREAQLVLSSRDDDLKNSQVNSDVRCFLPAGNDASPAWSTPHLIHTSPGASVAVPLNRLYGYPFVIGRRLKLAAIKVYHGAAGAAGSVYRLGIYDTHPTAVPWQPKNLLWDSGEQDGTKGADYYTYLLGTPIILDSGLYWQVFHCGVASPFWPSRALCESMAQVHSAGGNNLNGVLKNTAYAALPALFPAMDLLMDNASYAYYYMWWRLDFP